jgi:hypothetical protein
MTETAYRFGDPPRTQPCVDSDPRSLDPVSWKGPQPDPGSRRDASRLPRGPGAGRVNASARHVEDGVRVRRPTELLDRLGRGHHDQLHPSALGLDDHVVGDGE